MNPRDILKFHNHRNFVVRDVIFNGDYSNSECARVGELARSLVALPGDSMYRFALGRPHVDVFAGMHALCRLRRLPVKLNSRNGGLWSIRASPNSLHINCDTRGRGLEFWARERRSGEVEDAEQTCAHERYSGGN